VNQRLPVSHLLCSFPVLQVTPDLLKGQQEISQQTHEETAKQILYNYLKDGYVSFSLFAVILLSLPKCYCSVCAVMFKGFSAIVFVKMM